jgi:hypothetical protein
MEPAFLKVKLFSSTPTALTEQIMKNVQHSFFSNSFLSDKISDALSVGMKQ